MGLTIHYGLKTSQIDIKSIRSVVQTIRDLATQLPFQEIGDVIEFKDRECDYDREDPWRWLKIQAGQYVQEENCFFKVPPLHIVAFTVMPGPRSEPANFGLARYPEVITVEELKKQVHTNLSCWSWNSCSKTQYASDPAAGGVANFVRCHGSIVALLDAVQSRNLASVNVRDESDYWNHRDVRKLAEAVGEWNEMVAAIAGQLKDLTNGPIIDAQIMQFADFERLEARGRNKLDIRPS
jgi:hypothetical protein